VSVGSPGGHSSSRASTLRGPTGAGEDTASPGVRASAAPGDLRPAAARAAAWFLPPRQEIRAAGDDCCRGDRDRRRCPSRIAISTLERRPFLPERQAAVTTGRNSCRSGRWTGAVRQVRCDRCGAAGGRPRRCPPGGRSATLDSEA
jgi:hypothetical protein